MKKYSINTRKLKVWALGLVVGAILGYLYWYYFGCEDVCAIRSSPFNMTLYGAVMGGLLADLVREYFIPKKQD